MATRLFRTMCYLISSINKNSINNPTELHIRNNGQETVLRHGGFNEVRSNMLKIFTLDKQ